MFDLTVGQELELPGWQATSNVVAGTNKARPLPNSPFSPLAKINVRSKFANISFDAVTLRGDVVHIFYEAIQRDQIDSVVNTVFEFRCFRGKVRIWDVVLWYQTSV